MKSLWEWNLVTSISCPGPEYEEASVASGGMGYTVVERDPSIG